MELFGETTSVAFARARPEHVATAFVTKPEQTELRGLRGGLVNNFFFFFLL